MALLDRFGRRHTDLRVSVTDRCNLRCRYCMPADGLPWLPGSDLLDAEEIAAVVRVAVRLGVRSVRFTGGEPLLRRDLVDIVRRVRALDARLDLSVTTNGMRLARLAGPLAEAGLQRVNVSLDTLRPDAFRAVARRDGLPAVLAGLAAAHAAGLLPVKVNAVLVRGVNDQDVVPLTEFCLQRGYRVRFIEQMPLDAQRRWDRARMVTSAEVLDRLADRWSLTPVPGRGSSPAEEFLLDGGPGRVGVVASVTRPFCAGCDRIRLTADGQLRNCLFATEEADLRGPLRAGADDGELAARIRRAVAGKKAGHGIDGPGFVQPARPMSAIGG